MKKFLSLILVLSLFLCLVACDGSNQPPTEPPTEPTVTEPAPTEPQWPGYTGPKGEYTYFHEDERDVKWEEDVIYFANSYLDNHPLLSNRRYLFYYPMGKGDNGKFYSEALHNDYVAGINALIPEISQLTDNQIICRMMMLLAPLEDLHTSLSGLDFDVFPISFLALHENDEFIYYVNILPEEHQDLLFSKLISINGYSVEEVLQMMRSIIGVEHDYNLNWVCGHGYIGNYFAISAVLESLGIIEVGSNSIVYTLDLGNSATTSLELELVGDKKIQYTSHTKEDAYPISYGTNSNGHYWFTTELADHTLFLRINSFQIDYNYDYGTLGNQLNVAYQQANGFDKIIIDLRDNGGGYNGSGYLRLLTVLKSYNCSNIYVLINSGTYSRSTIFVAELLEMIEGVTIVGSPSGQNTEFFASMSYDFVMPNSKIVCDMPTALWDIFPEEECGLLMPDVVIWPTIDDFINCKDAILEYVLNQ